MLPVRVPQLLLQYPFVTRKVRESYSYPTPNHPRQDATLLYFTTFFFATPETHFCPEAFIYFPENPRTILLQRASQWAEPHPAGHRTLSRSFTSYTPKRIKTNILESFDIIQ